MRELVIEFGGCIGERHGDDLLRYLDDVSAEHWDFRRGRERNESMRADLTARQRSAVGDLAPLLGLAGLETPPGARYDTVLMTGGMVRAGIVKPRFVRQLLDGGLAARHVVFLGAFRPFGGDEHALAAALGVTAGGRAADNEVDAMVWGMQQAFDLREPPAEDGSGDVAPAAAWREYRWEQNGVRLSVVAAASTDPDNRRANTVDTYRFWAGRTRAADELSTLLVTTPVYVPHQLAGAIETLGVEHDIAVDAAGVSAAASDLGALTQRFTAGHHLQELRSAIRSMRSLRAALVRATG
ncbi:hypothetical protein [Marisediminicola senii]|uniref:hypothetical protein n=1 Tax=Marisediminicola senii TaxID=2711233 RepID=UPI0013EA52AB|nr:hypothetical protein [Marisediminicola senii]